VGKGDPSVAVRNTELSSKGDGMFYDRLPRSVRFIIVVILVIFTILSFADRLQGVGNVVFDVLLLLLFIDIVVLKRLWKKKED